MLEFFVDPVLRAPTLGSMLMCLASGLIGTLAFLQKRTLVGEALSHSAYPGIVLAVVVTAGVIPFNESSAIFAILIGAFLFGLLGLYTIHFLESRLRLKSDSALCFVLSTFFGVGVLVASSLQISHALWFRQIQIFLFGQAATMLDRHIFLYASLALLALATVIALYRSLQIIHFDGDFAKTLGMPVGWVQTVTFGLLVLAIVIGMRSVGVVLMSAMLIAPAAAARQWTKSLKTLLLLSSLIGMVSGFLGNAFSVWIPKWLGQPYLPLPTGPMIVLSATGFCFFSLLFAPKRGWITRTTRVWHFRFRSRQENLLKALYKEKPVKTTGWLMWRMKMKGWVSSHRLTKEGKRRAEKLIRLHRLWEVYLVHMGQHSKRVHRSAEEMEHILTPEIEKELLILLDDPKKDPHEQPIPGASS